jgi:hypothetical protein
VIVKTLANSACACTLALATALPAGAVEILDYSSTLFAAGHPHLSPLPQAVYLDNKTLSRLPEPEVFAMMLLGLVLIGYRASRMSSEKFEAQEES